MKKGFTLVEIIISIVLVLIIGTSTTLVVIKNSANKSLEKVTKQILEVANAYVKTEKDSNGKSFLNEINRGAKGVMIPVTTLVNSGYLKESLKNDLYDLTGEEKNYYVLFVNEEDYCDTGEITSIASWMDENNPIYLCNNYNTECPECEECEVCPKCECEEANAITSLITKNEVITTVESTLDLITINPFYDIGVCDFEEASNATFAETNGLHYISNEDKYIYRGVTETNYVKFYNGNPKAGGQPLPEMYRILSFEESTMYGAILTLISVDGISENTSKLGETNSSETIGKKVSDNIKNRFSGTNLEWNILRQNFCFYSYSGIDSCCYYTNTKQTNMYARLLSAKEAIEAGLYTVGTIKRVDGTVIDEISEQEIINGRFNNANSTFEVRELTYSVSSSFLTDLANDNGLLTSIVDYFECNGKITDEYHYHSYFQKLGDGRSYGKNKVVPAEEIKPVFTISVEVMKSIGTGTKKNPYILWAEE